MVLPFFARILRLASIVICLIAALYLGSFALDQTSTASSRQQAEVNETEPASAKPKQQSGLHKAIDEAFGKLASPFSGVTSSTSAWTIHIVDTLLVLIVYGFGLAFVARLLKLAHQ
jgi:hypothetical protein